MNYVSQIFIVIVALLLLNSLWKEGRSFARKLRIRIRGVRTQGTVISSRTEKNNDSTEFYATVRFRTDLMQNVEAECPESRVREVPPGTEVTIFYDPGEPNRFLIENRWIWIFQVVGFAGLLFALWQLLLLLRGQPLPWN